MQTSPIAEQALWTVMQVTSFAISRTPNRIGGLVVKQRGNNPRTKADWIIHNDGDNIVTVNDSNSKNDAQLASKTKT